MNDAIERLSQIIPSERILLLPHCLRRSRTCCATYDQDGLQCVDCNPECPVNRLRTSALEHGYKGVCVAPGGRLALKYVKEKKPEAIVAVACEKELEEGMQGVRKLEKDEIMPVVVIIPLVKDGCVDTMVGIEEALAIVDAGCMETAGNKGKI